MFIYLSNGHIKIKIKINPIYRENETLIVVKGTGVGWGWRDVGFRAG